MLADLLAWVEGLPAVALYAMLALAAGVENVFPPAPADTIVAFGAFVAARGEASLLNVFLATWLGNVATATLIFWLGRRLGTPALHGRFRKLAHPEAQQRVLELYRRWGIAGIFVTRFLPAARAVVPPLAGALRLPAVGSIVAMATASGLWYGAIALVAFRVGANWEAILARVGALGRTSGLLAAGVVLLIVAVVIWRRRRRSASVPDA